MRAAILALIYGLILAPPLQAQSAEEVALVKRVFAELQPISIRKNREYCGYIGWNAEGRLVASPARRGRKGACTPKDPRNIVTIVASYHTHGAFEPRYANEIPSDSDMESDADEGINGWVATPGGRLWYIDTVAMATWQICGLGCLPQDARFEPGNLGVIARFYTYNQIVELLNGG